MVYTCMYHEYQRDRTDPEGEIEGNPATSSETAAYNAFRDYLREAEELQKSQRLMNTLDDGTSD